jgi:DUF971 family protein
MTEASEIRVRRAEKLLEITFTDGEHISLPAEYLRVESPSAEVQGHMPSQRKTVSGRRHVGIIAVEPVGHYGIKLTFDDLHDTGIYSWDYLRMLAHDHDKKWAAYLAELEEKRLSRDP